MPVDQTTLQIVAAGGAVALIGGLSLRKAFATAALNRTLRQVTPAVEEFRNNIVPYQVSQTAAQRRTAKTLADMVNQSEAIHKTVMADMKTAEIPKVGKMRHTAVMNNQVKEVCKIVGGVCATTATYKLAKIFTGEVAYRAAKAAGDPANAPAWTALQQTAVDLMDKAGLVDAGVHVKQALADMIPQQVADATAPVVELLQPGVFSGLMTGAEEVRMLFNEQTDVADALENGVVPAAATFGLAKAGMFLDGLAHAFFIPTFGLFTIAGTSAGRLLKRKINSDSADTALNNLRPYLATIRGQKEQGIDRVNACIHEQFGSFAALRENCPKLVDDPRMRVLLKDVGQSLERDAAQLRTQINLERQRHIVAIPPRNWVDKSLGIDRPALMRNAYALGAEEKKKDLQRPYEAFKAAAGDPCAATKMLTTMDVRPHGHAVDFLNALGANRNFLVGIALAHEQSMQTWSQTCVEKWNTGHQAIRDQSVQESADMSALVARLKPTMEPHLRTLKANHKRLKRPLPNEVLTLAT